MRGETRLLGDLLFGNGPLCSTGLKPIDLRSSIQRPEGRCSLPNAQVNRRSPRLAPYERGPVRGTPLRWDDSSGV